MEWFEKITATDDGRRKLKRESAMLNATEVICELMQREGINRAELARRLGWRRARVTEILKHQKNLTLHTLSDIFHALNSEVFIDEKRPLWIEREPELATVAMGD